METREKEFIGEKLREFENMRPLVSGPGNEEAKRHLQSILDSWWNTVGPYKNWLHTTLTEAMEIGKKTNQ